MPEGSGGKKSGRMRSDSHVRAEFQDIVLTSMEEGPGIMRSTSDDGNGLVIIPTTVTSLLLKKEMDDDLATKQKYSIWQNDGGGSDMEGNESSFDWRRSYHVRQKRQSHGCSLDLHGGQAGVRPQKGKQARVLQYCQKLPRNQVGQEATIMAGKGTRSLPEPKSKKGKKQKKPRKSFESLISQENPGLSYLKQAVKQKAVDSGEFVCNQDDIVESISDDFSKVLIENSDFIDNKEMDKTVVMRKGAQDSDCKSDVNDKIKLLKRSNRRSRSGKKSENSDASLKEKKENRNGEVLRRNSKGYLFEQDQNSMLEKQKLKREALEDGEKMDKSKDEAKFTIEGKVERLKDKENREKTTARNEEEIKRIRDGIEKQRRKVEEKEKRQKEEIDRLIAIRDKKRMEDQAVTKDEDKTLVVNMEQSHQKKNRDAPSNKNDCGRLCDREETNLKQALDPLAVKLEEKHDAEKYVDDDGDVEKKDVEKYVDCDDDVEKQDDEKSSERGTESVNLKSHDDQKDGLRAGESGGFDVINDGPYSTFKSDWRLDKEGRSCDLEENDCSFDSCDSYKSLDCSLSSWEKCTGVELCSSIPAVDQWRREDLCWLMLHRSEDINKLVEEFRNRFCKKEHDIKWLSTVIEKVINSGIRNSDNNNSKWRKENWATEKQTVSGVSSKYDVEKKETKNWREDSDNLHDEKKENMCVKDDSEAVDKSCCRNISVNMEKKSEEERLICCSDDVVEGTVDEYAALENSITFDDYSGDNLMDDETDVEIIDAEDKDGQEKEADSAKIKELKNQKIKEREELNDEKMEEREEEFEDDNKDNLMRCCQKVCGGNGQKPGRKSNLSTDIYSLDMQMMQCSLKVKLNELDADINEIKLKAEKLTADIILALEAIRGYRGGAMSDKQDFMHHHGFKKTRLVLKVDMNEWRKGKQQRSKGLRDYTKISKARQKKLGGHSWIRRSSGRRGHEMFRCRRYGRQCSQGTSGSGNRQNSKEGSGNGNSRNNADKNSKNDNNQQNRDRNGNQNNNNPGKNNPNDANNPVQTLQEKSATRRFIDVSIPDPDFKGPRKKVVGESSDVKHKDLDNFEWLDKIVIYIQEDGGPSLRFFQAVDNSVYVCVSMCLMNPEQLSAEGFLCSVCLTVDSLLKHFANCSASFNSCDMCVKMFTLICSHVSECNSSNAVFECEVSICRIVNTFLGGNDITTHMKTLWFQVRKKLARIIGVEMDEPEPVPLPRTPEDRPVKPAPRGHPILSGRHSGPLPSIPEGAPLSINSTSRSSSKILARKISILASVGEQLSASVDAQQPAGKLSVEPAGALEQTSPTSSTIYIRVETSAEVSEQVDSKVGLPALSVRPETEQDALPTSSEEGSAESVESGGGSGNYPTGRKIVSMPIGPPARAEPYYPSFQDTPTGIKGIGEVVYANKQQLVKVVTIWEQFKVQYHIEAKLAKHYREEGVILYEFRNKLRINGLRYNRDFQWIKTAHLGNGMTGKCLLATDFETDFKFCVKELHIANYEKQEIELWLELEHPHIVQVYGAIRHGEKIYILQEFIEGGCLTEAINVQKKLGRRLSQVIALKYFHQLLQVLKYLKSRNILHEDLKADNILLNNTGNGISIKVTDFGLARRCQGIVRQGTAPVGTQTQWSPEKAKAEGYSFSAEVWAAVCVLVHMLSGLPPWMRRYETFKALIVVIVEKSPPIEDIPQNILPQIKELIHWGFTVHPSKRPTAEQLLNHEAFRILEEPQATATYSILESVHHASTNHIDDDPNADLREIYRNLISEGKGATGAAPSKLLEINPEVYQHSNDYYVYTAHQTGEEVGRHGESQGQGQSMTLNQEDNSRRAPHTQHDMEILHQQISRSEQGRPRRPSQPDQNMDPSKHYEQFYNDNLTNVIPLPTQSNLTMYYPSDGSDVHNSHQESVNSSSSESITRKIPDFSQLALSSDSEGKSVQRFLPDFQSKDFSEDEDEAKPPKEEISFEDASKHFRENYLPTVIGTPDLSKGSKTSSVAHVQGMSPSPSRENAAVLEPVSQCSGETVRKDENRSSITPNRRSDGNGLTTPTSTISPDNSGSVRYSPVNSRSFPSTPGSQLSSKMPHTKLSYDDDPIKSINNDDDLFMSGSPPQSNQHGGSFADIGNSSWHSTGNRDAGIIQSPQGHSSYYAPGSYVPQNYAIRSPTAETHATSGPGHYQPGTSWQNTGKSPGSSQHMPNVPYYQTCVPSNQKDGKQWVEGYSVMPKPNIPLSSVSQRFPSPQSTSRGYVPGGLSHGMVRTNYEPSSLPSPYHTAQIPGHGGTRLVSASANRHALPTEIYYQSQNTIYQQQYQTQQLSPSGHGQGLGYSPVNHGQYSQNYTKGQNDFTFQGQGQIGSFYRQTGGQDQAMTVQSHDQQYFQNQGQMMTGQGHDRRFSQGHQNQYGPVSLPTSRDSNIGISPEEPQSLMNPGRMGHFNPSYTSTPMLAVPHNGARPKIFLPPGPQQGPNVSPRYTANLYDKQELTTRVIIDPRQVFLSESGLRFSPMTTRAPYPQQPKTPILNPAINPIPDILSEGGKADLRLDINKAKQMSGPTAVSMTKTAPVITPPKTPSKKSPDLQRTLSHAPLIARSSQTLSNSTFSPNQRDDKMSSSTSRSQFEEQDEAFRELEHTAEEALSQHSDPEHRIFLNIYDHDDIDKPIVGELDDIDLENPAASLAHMLDSTDDNSVTVTFRSAANRKEFKMRFEARTSLKHWEKIIKEELDGFSRLRMTEEYGLKRFCLKKEDGSVLDLESCLGSRRSQVMLMVEAVDNDPWWIEDGMISM